MKYIDWFAEGVLRLYRWFNCRCLYCGENSYGKNWCTWSCQASDGANGKFFKF